MPEIVESKNRRGETRYGWCCECGSAAGAWPQRETAIGSAQHHSVATITQYTRNKNGAIVQTHQVPRCQSKRTAAV